MKQYKIFENEVGRREAVKQGWSWPAFLFTFIWPFVKRLYVAGAIVLGGVIVVVLLSWKADELFAMGDKSARSWTISVNRQDGLSWSFSASMEMSCARRTCFSADISFEGLWPPTRPVRPWRLTRGRDERKFTSLTTP